MFGVKVMYDTWVDDLLPWLRTVPWFVGKDDVEIFQSFFPNCRVVLISRRNKLEQAISWLKAQRTGIWEYRGKEIPYLRDALVFDYLGIAETVNRIEREESYWRRFGSTSPFPFCEESFEDFREDWPREACRVLRSFGIPCPRRFAVDDSKLRVMKDETNARWLAAFKDTRDRIAGLERAPGFRPLPVEDCRADIQISTGRHPAFRTFSNMTVDGMAEVRDGCLRTETRTRLTLRLRVSNLSTFEWPDLGQADGRLWVLVRAAWRKEGAPGCRDEGRGYLPSRLLPGAGAAVDLPLTAPDQPGAYVLELALEQQGVGPLGGPAAAVAFRVEVQTPIQELDCQAFLGPLAQLSEGWKRSAWYGDLMDWNFPWIYHAGHGWQQCLESRDGVLCIEDAQLGRLNIRPGEYPLLVQADSGRRLRYERGPGTLRRFQCVESGEWLEVRRND